MAITKILNIKESEGRNPASHLKNALEYIQNPDKTEECVLVGGINCLADTAFEQMEETKNIFHKTGKRQGYHVIISFSPEEKVTAEQAMYVLEHFAKDVLGDDYEAVYAVHTDREHMHGHLIWNSVSMTTGKKYNSPKGNWKNHLQPITNKYCDELGLSIMPAEYSRNPKNISRDKWEREMSMKEIILRDAKMCAYAAGNVEHFKYMMKRLGYVFKKDAWMEVQAPGFRYYQACKDGRDVFRGDIKASCGYALDGKALLLFVGYQETTQGEAVTIPEEVLRKAIQIKGCRTEAFCSRWSKVCRGFEEVSSVTG